MNLPPKVHVKNGRYYYVHRNKWHSLTKVEEGEPAMRKALEEVLVPAPRWRGSDELRAL